MGCLSDFCGGNSMWWILILLLILDNGSGSTCDSLIWILLLSRFCNCDPCNPCNPCSCGCGNQPNRSCGC